LRFKEESMKKPVVVTTKFRGVFFGYEEERGENSIVLTNTRNCIYWSEDVGGFMGLASKGPSRDCKLGTKTSRIELFGITSIMDVSKEAAEKWER